MVCSVSAAWITRLQSTASDLQLLARSGQSDVPVDLALCSWCVEQRESDLVILGDSHGDSRFKTAPPLRSLRFYAGALLIGAQGQVLGTLAVADLQPRGLSEAQKGGLRSLARQTVRVLERLGIRDTSSVPAAVEENFRIREAAIATSAVAIAFGDMEGRISYVNQAFLDLFGYDGADKVLGRSNTEFAMRPEEVREIMHALREKGRWRGEIAAKRRDGTELWVLASASVVKNATGHPVCTMASLTDVTDQRNAERRFRRVLESAPDAILLVARDQTIGLVNSQAERLFGYAREELLGQRLEMLIPEGFCETERRHSNSSGEPGEPVSATADRFEIVARRKDGVVFPVEVSLSPFGIEEGFSGIAVVRDNQRTQARGRGVARERTAVSHIG